MLVSHKTGMKRETKWLQDGKELAPPCTAGGNVKSYSPWGKHLAGSSKN